MIFIADILKYIFVFVCWFAGFCAILVYFALLCRAWYLPDDDTDFPA